MQQVVEACRLVPFRAHYADQIVTWAADAEQLRLLAPSTVPPLTASKVVRWRKPGGRAYAYVHAAALPADHPAELVGYFELNRMQHPSRCWWIGHFVVSPGRRGRGIGRAMLSGALSEAFTALGATGVCLVVFPENAAAIRCYETGGFRKVGEEFHEFGRDRRKHRLLRYEMSLDEWRNRRSPA